MHCLHSKYSFGDNVFYYYRRLFVHVLNQARAILQKYGVDINDPANGTFLPTVKDVAEGAYHPSLHTNAYYDKVNKLLSEATCKEDVLDILDDISEQLQCGTFK